MTLIELLIAMSLLSALVTLLLGFYSDVHFIDRLFDKNREQAFEIRYAQIRIWEVGSKIAPYVKNNKKRYFFTEEENTPFSQGPSLTFTYDNGADFEPDFSTFVIGKIYLDLSNRLCLATWPLPNASKSFPPPMKKEVLMERVEKLDFEFFFPLDGNQTASTPLPESERSSTWSHEFKTIPASIWIKITKLPSENSQQIAFAVPLPKSKKHIIYPK